MSKRWENFLHKMAQTQELQGALPHWSTQGFAPEPHPLGRARESALILVSKSWHHCDPPIPLSDTVPWMRIGWDQQASKYSLGSNPNCALVCWICPICILQNSECEDHCNTLSFCKNLPEQFQEKRKKKLVSYTTTLICDIFQYWKLCFTMRNVS